VLLYSAARANAFFRRQYLIILLASIIPIAINSISLSNFGGPVGMDLTPVSFGVSSVIYMYAIYQFQFMNLLPVARGYLIENMSDGVLVVDKQGRILDVNPAIKNFLENASVSLIGRDISDVFREWQHNADPILNGLETRTEMIIPHSPTRYMDLRVTNLYDDQNKFNGRLIVFRDVTDRKEVEKDLRRFNDRLQTQLIEIGRLQSQLREQAIRDALTNVFNRRYLEETLDRELSRAEREKYPLCVIMMDLDFFKDVNDTYGHEAGDMVLKALANTVIQQSRHGDFVCRYGGEEFVLVMPNITMETARQRADTLHQAVNSMQIPYGVFNLTTTISMGVAMYPEHGKTKEELVRAADRAMYIAKNTGRNRVVVFEETGINAD
jgi:diguanylate cyclase (GGDEF)-like protein/PAS domain S-box-containing protein